MAALLLNAVYCEDVVNFGIAEMEVDNTGMREVMSTMQKHVDVLMEMEKARSSPDASLAVGANNALSSTCNNYNCDFFFYFLTCKELNINMDKICASYFVGNASFVYHLYLVYSQIIL